MYIIRECDTDMTSASVRDAGHESKGTKAIFEDVRWLPIAMTAMADVVGCAPPETR